MIKPILYRQNTLQESLKCLSKSENDTDFNYTQHDDKLKVDSKQINQSQVTCFSKHLTVFGPMFIPSLTEDQNNATKSEIPTVAEIIRIGASVFDEYPLLKYLLPIIFILGVFILAILGLIMSRMEFMHRKRFFNKLSLQENISRYGLCRLIGCLIL